MNIRRNIIYNAVKRLVWQLWRPYRTSLENVFNGTEKISSKIQLYVPYKFVSFGIVRFEIDIPVKGDLSKQVNLMHDWAFENLSITGKLIK